MTQQYTPVEWVDESGETPGTLINKARLDQMQTAHHFADGFEEVDTIPTGDPGVDYHKVVYCTATAAFYRWTGTEWIKDTAGDGIQPWRATILFEKDDLVLYDDYLYISLQDNNLNHEPHGNDAWWKLAVPAGPQGPAGEVVSAGDMVVRYIGDGTAKVFSVTHNLGTTKVIYSMQANGVFVDAAVSVIDENNLRVEFSRPPLPNEVTMAIYSGGYIPVPVVSQYVHDQSTPSATWSIAHNLDRYVQVQVQDTAGSVIIGKVTQTDTNNVTVEFNAPTAGKAIIE